MRCSALTAKGEPCKSPAGPNGYCKRHADTHVDVPHDASQAERTLREQAPFIVARIRAGSAPIASFGASGIRPAIARSILAIADGGEPDVKDEGYRAACEQVVQRIRAAAAERDGELAASWAQHATKDWRAAKAYLEARSGEEWQPTQQVQIDGEIRGRSEEAVLDALAALTGGGDGGDRDA